LSSERRRQLVEDIMSEHPLSERRACRIIRLSRSVKHYQARPRDDQDVVTQLKQLAETYPRWALTKGRTGFGIMALCGTASEFIGCIGR
jgi:hypothetical protein